MLSQLADYKVPYTPYHSHPPTHASVFSQVGGDIDDRGVGSLYVGFDFVVGGKTGGLVDYGGNLCAGFNTFGGVGFGGIGCGGDGGAAVVMVVEA